MHHMKAFLALILIVASACASAAGPNDEDVAVAFDRHKGGFYAAYAKELRTHPGLKGKAVLVIDFAKTGDVTGCRVRSSTLGSPALEAKLCEVARRIKIAPRAAGFTVDKPIDFFPAA
jgi:periplasmic protein TonB